MVNRRGGVDAKEERPGGSTTRRGWRADTESFPPSARNDYSENLKADLRFRAAERGHATLLQYVGYSVLRYGLTGPLPFALDDPRRRRTGRVGPAISGIEMRLGENDEIACAANIFPGY
jgi:hypothetical protein